MEGSRPVPAGILIAGDYRIVRPLSSGGMGAVYVAQQQSTGKLRALKMMHPGLLEDEGLRARFAQEARVGSMLASSHVVEVIGAGVDEATRMPWLAMELLDGEDLATYVERQGCLALGESVEILKQACHALAAAHAVGVVHRDVKPENLFLARVQGVNVSLSVKVLDFGIAKILAAQSRTVSGLGTPMWMAPEQALSGIEVGPSTDVWALGLVAFWMLTGVKYWRTANNPGGSMPELLREIGALPLVPASARAAELGAFGRLPGGFDAWFARCVVRDPAARYRAAGEAMAALAALAATASEASSATAESASQAQAQPQAYPASGVNPWLVIAGGLGLLVLSCALTFVVVLHDRESGDVTALTASPPVPPSPPSASRSGPAADVAQPPPIEEAGRPPLLDSGPPDATVPAPSARATALPAIHRARVPSAPVPSAKASLRLFDHEAAYKAVERASRLATIECANFSGPTTVRFDLLFMPNGSISRGLTDPAIAGERSVLCVSGIVVTQVHVAPFDGLPQHLPATVSW